MANEVQVNLNNFGNGIQFQYEGVNLGDKGTVTKVNIKGGGITATQVGNTLTITVAGAGTGGSGLFGLWDLSSNQFPANSTEGQRYYGINGPSTTLHDRNGDRIPNGVIATSLEDNASISDPTKWALQYTII